MACIVLLYKVYCVCTYECICVCGCVYLLWLRKWIHWPELPFRHTKTACTATQRLASRCLRDLTYDLMTDGSSLPETMATTIWKTTVEDSKKQHKLKAIDISLSMSLSFFPSLSPMCFQSAELKVIELLCDQSVYYSNHWPSSPQLTRAPEHWGPLYISCSLSASIFMSISYSLVIYSHVWQCKGVSRKEVVPLLSLYNIFSALCWQWTWNGLHNSF